MTMSIEAITAQIACEAVANNPTAYNARDIDAVIHVAKYAGVAASYIEAIKHHRSQKWYDEAYAGM